MADSAALTLRARTSFRAGEIGWVTTEGVIKIHPSIGGYEGLPTGSFAVRAVAQVTAGTHGEFSEIYPDPTPRQTAAR
jgi:hypothetical protein